MFTPIISHWLGRPGLSPTLSWSTLHDLEPSTFSQSKLPHRIKGEKGPCRRAAWRKDGYKCNKYVWFHSIPLSPHSLGSMENIFYLGILSVLACNLDAIFPLPAKNQWGEQTLLVSPPMIPSERWGCWHIAPCKRGDDNQSLVVISENRQQYYREGTVTIFR